MQLFEELRNDAQEHVGEDVTRGEDAGDDEFGLREEA